MASSTTPTPTFSFPQLHTFPTTKPPKPHRLPICPRKPTFPSLKPTASIPSTDVSKEGKPLSDPEPPSDEQATRNLDPRRFQEKFAVLNTGIYECRSCGYRYDEAAGDPSYPIPPGFEFGKLPEDWRCPTCGAAKSFFESKSVEIAGFSQNQQFGFGANTLTSGQKAVLIYGGLLLGFIFFLSGYFLQ